MIKVTIEVDEPLVELTVIEREVPSLISNGEIIDQVKWLTNTAAMRVVAAVNAVPNQ